MYSAEEGLLSERDVEATFKISRRLRQKWRRLGMGPDYYKVYRSVRYRKCDIENSLKACRINRNSKEGNAGA